MTIAERHAGPVTSEEIATVLAARRQREGRFDYLVGEDLTLTRIGTQAIATLADEVFATLRADAAGLGHVSSGMIATALNELVHLHHEHQASVQETAFARKLADQRRAASRCTRCGRRLSRPSPDGLGPECRRWEAVLAARGHEAFAHAS